MIRTQIYLTEAEQNSLVMLSQQTGESRSQLIRKAIDHLIGRLERPNKKALLQGAKGLWRTRKDLPNFRAIRQEFDRTDYAEDNE